MRPAALGSTPPATTGTTVVEMQPASPRTAGAAAGPSRAAAALPAAPLQARAAGPGAASAAAAMAPRQPTPAAGPPQNAAELQARFGRMGPAGGPEAERQAFDANVAYGQHPQRAGDVRTATLNGAINVGGTAAATFGTGRPLSNPATYGSRLGSVALNGAMTPAITAGGGTVANMAVQSVLPAAAGRLAPMRMAAVPVEALVPRTGPELTQQQQQFREQAAARQQQLATPGTLQNALTGSVAFGAAQAVRLGVEAAAGPAAGAAAWAASAAVSAGAGAAFGATMAQRQAAATMAVPNPHAGQGQPAEVNVPLFQPTPSRPGVFTPPWGSNNPAEVAASAGMRFGNLAVAGGQLQAATQIGAVAPPGAAVAAGSLLMASAAGAYFAVNDRIGRVETQRNNRPAPAPLEQVVVHTPPTQAGAAAATAAAAATPTVTPQGGPAGPSTSAA